jgi:hypothetical protein
MERLSFRSVVFPSINEYLRVPAMNQSKSFSLKTVTYMGVGSLILASVFVGGFLVGDLRKSPDEISKLLPLVLQADTASAGKSVSVATARMNEDVECVYILDHVAQNLVCFVMDYKNRTQPVGTYVTSLKALFPGAKQGDLDLSMVTGFISSNEGGRTAPQRFAENICYVLEGNTGVIAGFTFQFNQTGIRAASAERGELIPVWKGLFRDPSLNPKPVDAKAAGDKAKDKDKAAPAADDKKK